MAPLAPGTAARGLRSSSARVLDAVSTPPVLPLARLSSAGGCRSLPVGKNGGQRMRTLAAGTLPYLGVAITLAPGRPCRTAQSHWSPDPAWKTVPKPEDHPYGTR